MVIRKCDESDYHRLVVIWERSVRCSHDFLTDDIICEIREALIPCYFPNVALYGVEDRGVLVGFVGIAGRKIEMLFVDSDCRGCGYGSALIDYAVKAGATDVDVNEQNPSARAFYEAKCFAVISRDETDDSGRPFPILHMSLADR